jgi:hypothetical protein
MKRKASYVLTPDLQFQRFQNYDEIEEIFGISKPLIVAQTFQFLWNYKTGDSLRNQRLMTRSES